MYLPLDKFSPDVKIGLVSASRNCFPRGLSESRMEELVRQCAAAGIPVAIPDGECRIIETKLHARHAAEQMLAAGCDGVVLYLGNFSPEIEDAFFVKKLTVPVMIIAAAEESAATLAGARGDALCGMLSAVLAMKKRGLLNNVHIPADPIVDPAAGATAIARFSQIVKVVKGMRKATIGLFGPRPRDFESCNYNVASLASIGVEIEELGFFDLVHEIERVRAAGGFDEIIESMRADTGTLPDDRAFVERLAAYEKAVLALRDRLGLSGMTSQCWSEQEFTLKHVPCFINARMAARGFPVACENDAYSLCAELLAQYASGQSVTILDINHSIPADMPGLPDRAIEDLVGLFHCGNTDPRRLKDPALKYQLIMKRLMEPDSRPDITRGTLEGTIASSPITVVQVHGQGDTLQAYLCQGEFLPLDSGTFGSAGTAYLPGFRRFYRHVILGNFHHHAAVAFSHCGGVLYNALKFLGVGQIHTPISSKPLYPGENPFGE